MPRHDWHWRSHYEVDYGKHRKKKDKNLTVSYMWSLVKDDLGELQRKSTMALTRNQGVKVTGKDDKDLVIGAKLDTDRKKNSGFVLHGEVTVFNIL